MAGTSLLLCDSICWALDILWLLRIVTINGFVTAASTFSRDKMKIKDRNQPRPERPQCQAQPLFPPSKVFLDLSSPSCCIADHQVTKVITKSLTELVCLDLPAEQRRSARIKAGRMVRRKRVRSRPEEVVILHNNTSFLISH